MGLFGRTYIFVASAALPVIDTENRPDEFAEAMHRARVKEENFIYHFKKILSAGIASKVRQFYRYGKDQYVYGLPSIIKIDVDETVDTIQEQLNVDEGVVQSITDLVYAKSASWDMEYALRSATHYIYSILQGQGWLYDPSSPGAHAIIPLSIEVHAWDDVNDTDTVQETALWGIPCLYNYTKNLFLIEHQFSYELHIPVTRLSGGAEETLTLFLNKNVITGWSAYTGRHVPTASPSDIEKYFFYSTYFYVHLRKGITLLNSYNYYPILSLRKDKVSLSEVGDTVLYKDTKKALKKLNLDIDTILDAINSHTEISKIRDAFFSLEVNVLSDRQEALTYLFNFFEELSVLYPNSKTNYEAIMALPIMDENFAVPDLLGFKIDESRFNKTISFNYIEKTTIPFISGLAIGTILPSHGVNPMIIMEYSETDETGTYVLKHYEVPDNSYMYMKYIGNSQAEVITIHGLVATSLLSGKYEIIQDSAGTNTSRITIPLNKEAVENSGLTLKQKNELFYESMHIIIYAKESVDVSWYESASFWKFVQGIVLVFSVAFGGFDVPTTITIEVIVEILVTVIVIYLAGLAAGWIATEIGGAAGAVIGIIVYYVLVNYFGTLTGNEMPEGIMALQASNSVINVFTEEQLEKINTLHEDEAVFNEKAEEAQKELDEFSKAAGIAKGEFSYLLEKKTEPYFNLDETPEEFFIRTLNDNLPADLINTVDNYHNAILSLPKPKETLKKYTTKSDILDASELHVGSNWFIM